MFKYTAQSKTTVILENSQIENLRIPQNLRTTVLIFRFVDLSTDLES